MLERARKVAGGCLHWASHAVQRHENAMIVWPVLPVTYLDVAMTFHRRLGFTVTAYSDGYAWVSDHTGERYHLNRIDELDPATNHTQAYLHVHDAPGWHQRLQDEGVTTGDLLVEPWGKVEFHVVDPDGNRLRIGSPAPSTAEELP